LKRSPMGLGSLFLNRSMIMNSIGATSRGRCR
jgi:hypothetical protein